MLERIHSTIAQEIFPYIRRNIVEIRDTLIQENEHMAVGIIYYKNPDGLVEVLAEVKKGITGDKNLKLPGGHVEKSDPSVMSAFLREFQEETGVKLLAQDLVQLKEKRNSYRNARNKKIYVKVDAFALKVANKPAYLPQPSEEDIDQYEWVTVEEFKRRGMHKSSVEAIDSWVQEINTI